MNHQKLKALLALLIYIIIGSAITPSMAKIGLQTIDPFTFLFTRQFFTLMLAVPILIKHKKLLNKKNTSKLFQLSFLFGLNIVFFTFGIIRTTIFVSQLLYATLPINVSIISYFFLREKISHQKLVGILLSFLGIGLVLSSSFSAQSQGTGTIIGNLFFVGAVLCYSLYIIRSKQFSKKLPSNFTAAATYLLMPLYFLPFGIYGFFTQGGLTHASLPSLFSLAGIGIFSFGLIFFFQYGVKRVSSITASLVSLLSPEIAAISGSIFFDEKISFIVITSTVLVLSGLIISLFEKQESFLDKMVQLVKKLGLRVFS